MPTLFIVIDYGLDLEVIPLNKVYHRYTIGPRLPMKLFNINRKI